MARKIINGKEVDVPIEKFTTAPLGSTKDMAPLSKVPNPSEVEIRDAKDWVDAKQS